MAKWLFLTLLLANVPIARAQPITPVLVAPATPPVAGSQCSLWLYCMNDSPNAVTQTFPLMLPGTLTSATGPVATMLWLNTNRSDLQAVINPGGFVKTEYDLTIPASVAGPVTLTVSNYNQIIIPVVIPRAGASPAVAVQKQPPSPSVSTHIVHFFDNHLSPYEPIYFILGTYPAAEFQFSIKYKVFDFTNTDNPLAHFYFAYTQTSFWDLISKDPSFYDSSYKPSAFLYYTNVLHLGFFNLDLQPGVEHESNGQGGTGERSLYTAYLQPTATLNLPYNFQFMLQPRAWCYLGLSDNNPDMAAYRGYGYLRTALTWADPDSSEKIQFATKLETGDEWTHDGYTFDLRFNLADVPFLNKFSPTIQVQYFTGYGQTLRQYNQSSHGLRAGLCLWY